MSQDIAATFTFKPAATVVIFRHAAPGRGDAGAPELLMVQRAKEMRFAGGAAVFPGGRIDPADCALAAAIAPRDDPDMTAARIAGVRETLEETGLVIAMAQQVSTAEAIEARALLLETGTLAPVLARYGWSLALGSLVAFARWCPQWDGAFDARFFLHDLGTGAVDVVVDATENSRLFWASAAEVLALADAGEVQVIFPTRRNLERLAQFATFAQAREHAETTPIRTISPAREERDGTMYLTIPEGLGYPVTAQALDTVRRG